MCSIWTRFRGRSGAVAVCFRRHLPPPAHTDLPYAWGRSAALTRASARDICGRSGCVRVAEPVRNCCSKGLPWSAMGRGFTSGRCCETWGGRGRCTGKAFPRNGGGKYSNTRVLFPVHYLSSHLAKIRPAHGRTNLNHTRQRQPPAPPRAPRSLSWVLQ